MKIQILSTGDELTRGRISDTNAQWIASMLDARGYRVARTVVVGDSLPSLIECVRDGLAHYDWVFVTGGLGPTEDDLTAQAVAAAFDLPLSLSDAALRVVQNRFAALGRDMPEINLRQARLPQGAVVLDNPVGTAPGFVVEQNGHRGVFMPGVPMEMRVMFEQQVLPMLPAATRLFREVFRIFGIGESSLQQLLIPILAEYPEIHPSFRVSFPEITLTLSAEHPEPLLSVETSVMEQIGAAVFSRSDVTFPEVVVAELLRTRQTVSTAESCTGGGLGHRLTEVPGSSAVYPGGIIAYENRIKTAFLDVSDADLQRHGAVSESVAVAMARGVRRRFETNFGVGITGIAGPSGGTVDKPAGTVHLALATADRVFHRHCCFTAYSREAVRRASVWTALQMLYDQLRGVDRRGSQCT